MICFRFRLFLFLILMIVQGSVSAQQKTTKVYGKVYSSDDVPASFVTLTLQSQGIKTKADINGSFSFTNLPALKDTLVISGVGFKTLKQAIALQNNQNINLDIIRLKYRINQLRHVEITACIKTSYKSDYSSAATKMPTAIKDLPLSVSTVTKELINDRMEFHLSNALENVSGVTHYSGYEEYNIRGLHAENPCLINGLRTFNTSLTSPQLLNVEKVELIKGPACVLYGNADPGGTVNLVIKKPLRQKQAVLEIGAGSWNAANMQADFTGPLNKSETWLYRLNAGYENKDSFRQGMFLKSTQIAPSFSFIPNNKLQVNLDVSLSNTNSVADRGQPGFRNAMDLTSTPVGLSLIQPGDYLKETSVSAGLSANYKFNSHISFNTGILGFMTWQRLAEHFLKNYITNDSVYLGYNHNKVNTSTLTLTNYFVFQFNTGRLNHEL
ncbi:MAG: TonB-dependent receptor plug domain-containing protein, partial [Bacteroidota bacterium]|nr:TonB-dependent receptor plug domain-containing protein [Bacteroidota bacterium]